ncbi:MAG TPA: hypothetical protein PKA27_13785 [Fimbriimonadaceae bacterium]|nr:hypothetical protein [Fimbriimonadaceae bacterium]
MSKLVVEGSNGIQGGGICDPEGSGSIRHLSEPSPGRRESLALSSRVDPGARYWFTGSSEASADGRSIPPAASDSGF